MTIASFCRDELLAGPLPTDELVTRAVAAGVTRARDPRLAVLAALRPTAWQLLDDRWVTPLQLLEGRCLTAAALPTARSWYGEPDPDLALLRRDDLASVTQTPAPGELFCVRVDAGAISVSTVTAPTPFGISAFAERLAATTPKPDNYYDRRRDAQRAVAQLMVDDPTAFRTPLPPLSTWVPALVEQAQREEESIRQWWEWEQDQSRNVQVRLDDDQFFQVQLAAERACLSVSEWVLGLVEQAIGATPRRHDVVVPLRRGTR